MIIKETKNGYFMNKEFVPNDPENSDYKQIQEWIANGGVVEPFDYLAEAKAVKIQELEIYHASPATKTLTINNHYLIAINFEGRQLIKEQIDIMEAKIKTGEETNTSSQTWDYSYNGGSVAISYEQLINLYVLIGEIVNQNFWTKKNHITAISALDTVEEVNSYDFTEGYLINQKITI